MAAGCETFQIQVYSDINEMLPKHLVLAENVDPNYPYISQVGKIFFIGKKKW